MTKKEFLDILSESLAGNVPVTEIEENMQYYKDYIENGEASEKDALENLGDPHLIARTIIESFKVSKGPMADFYTEQARNEYSKGTSGEDVSYQENIGYKIKWYDKLLIILVLIGVLLLVLALAGGILAISISVVGLLLRIALPVIIVLFIIKLITDYLHRG